MIDEVLECLAITFIFMFLAIAGWAVVALFFRLVFRLYTGVFS